MSHSTLLPPRPSLPSPREEYKARMLAAAERVASWSAESDRLSTQRGVVFLLGAVAFVLSRTVPAAHLWGGILAALMVPVFLRLLFVHARARFQIRWHEQVEEVNRQAIARLDRDWSALPEIDVEAPSDHPFADDLDVLGHASLLTLVGGAATRPGLQVLRDWLLEPAPVAEIRERQRAVSELSRDLDFREDLWARARLAGPVSDDEIRGLLSWAEEPNWVLNRPDLTWAARLLPLLTNGAIVAHIVGWVPYLWLPTIMVSAWVASRIESRVTLDFLRASMGERGLRRYAEIIEQASDGDFESPVLRTLRDGLTAGETPPPTALRRLFKLVELGEARRNVLHPILNLLFHWDIHILRAGERWKQHHGHDLRGWLSALGEIDALSALAGLAHAHPNWTFPTFVDEARIHAQQIAHPLLASDVGIPNDVKLGPPGTFLLVTGSNMSGKSTLLRSIGLNVVLAGSGGPVCAQALSLAPVELRASMRFRDALDEGLSYFMSGLTRLKNVVESAREATADRPVLYLLDEILQGTNTAERQIAARGVIRELLTCHAIGAVTTHDLSLADAPDLSESSQKVHFSDLPGTDEQPLIFDYTLRPGIATSTNALKLMELMGLALPDGDAPA
jgi:energy-coupling factor transporter ATP-binding protein EcfA2